MITDITAYRINGEYYFHYGTPNANTKKKIKRIIQEDKEDSKRRKVKTTIHSYSFVDGWEEAKKTKSSQKRTKNKNQ